jgi:hypothetical protein
MLKCNEGKPQPLENLLTGHPTLSLHDDDDVLHDQVQAQKQEGMCGFC